MPHSSFDLDRRRALVSAMTLAAPALPAFAQAYPSRPIQLVVPFPAGGVTDMLSRVLAQELGRSMSQPVVVMNQPGASGMIACVAVKQAPADGYTLLMGHIGTHAVNPSLYPKINYDPVADFAPLSLVATTPVMLLVNEQVPAKSLEQLTSLAKGKARPLTYGSFGAGSSSHLYAEMFQASAKLHLLHVPYKGPAPAMQDLIGGQIDMMFDTVASAMPQVKHGRVRALAVASSRRVAQAPDVPTFAEVGMAELTGGPWFALYAPRATPLPIRDRIESEVRKALAVDRVTSVLREQGIQPLGSTSEQLASHQRTEAARWGALVKRLNIHLE